MDDFKMRFRRRMIDRYLNDDVIPFITMKYLSDKQEETINKTEFQEKYGFLFRDYELLSNIIKKFEDDDDTYISDIKSSIIALKNSQNNYIKEVYTKIDEDQLDKQFLSQVLETINTDLNLFNRAIRNKYRLAAIHSGFTLLIYDLIADIATVNHKVSKVYDPTCHNGLTISSLKDFDKATLYESNEETYTQAIQNFIINDLPLEKINITNKEVLIDEDETKYDTIISVPFINFARKSIKSPEKFDKYKTRNPNAIHLLNLIEHLDKEGILITTVTQDLLVRKDALNLRKCLIEKNLLDAVIEFEGPRGENKLLIVINKNKKTNDFLLIKSNMSVLKKAIRRGDLVECYKDRLIKEHFSNLISKEELRKNEYKILPKRYVYSLDYEKHSINEVKAQQQKYTEEIHKLDEEISKLLEQLNE